MEAVRTTSILQDVLHYLVIEGWLFFNNTILKFKQYALQLQLDFKVALLSNGDYQPKVTQIKKFYVRTS